MKYLLLCLAACSTQKIEAVWVEGKRYTTKDECFNALNEVRAVMGRTSNVPPYGAPADPTDYVARTADACSRLP